MAKILLVEDDKSLREIYYVRLKAEGYDIVSAGDGEEALAMAIKEKPDLIVSDVMMPKISGFDMLDILRSTTETKNVKVIMMTALSSEDQRARGEALGADRYLVKSQVGIEDVVRTVHEVMGDGVATAAPAPSFSTAVAPAATPAAQAEPVPTPAAALPVAPIAAPAPVEPTPAPIAEPAALPVINLASAPIPAAPAPQTPSDSVISTPPPSPTTPTVEPFALPTPDPTFQMPAAAPVPAPAEPAPTTLPEPIAPFSTPQPTSQGDRTINPISAPDATPINNIADQMNQELGAQNAPAQPPIPPAPGASL